MSSPCRQLISIVLLALALSFEGLAALPASAQVQTGMPPFGSFAGGPDIINPANLNDHLTASILNKPGRGLPFTFFLTYDSSIWTPVRSNGSTTWQSAPRFGWNGSELNIGNVSSFATSSTAIRTCPVTHLQGGTQTTVISWTYVDGFGTPHQFPTPSRTSLDLCTNAQTSSPGGGTALDGSGYTLSANGFTFSSLVAADGNAINAPVNTNAGAGSIQDRNGNQISVSASGVFTDTLNTTALTVANSTPSATTPTTYSYAAPNGGLAKYTVNYTSYTVATNFGISGITEFGATIEPLVSSIVLPDNSQYTFAYEATPAVPASGACTPKAGTFSSHCVTARLASVTIPTGGKITYSYTGGNNGILPDGSAATLTRTTPDGTWTYAQVKNTGAASTTTVTDPQNNVTVMNFQSIYETQRQIYQGAVAPANLLRTWNTCYNGGAVPCTTTAIALPITTRTVIDQYGSTGVQCKHVYSYNTLGQLTEQDDFDYGSGAPGVLLRKHLTTYAALGNNINTAPQSITIQDGLGNVKAQTTLTYDEGAPAPTSGTPQHAAVSGSRGNPTTSTKLVQGTTSLTTHFTYFDTGTMQTSTDVNGAVTTFNYPDATSTCGNAFPTSVSLPLGLSTFNAWNCVGAVPTSTTDANGKITTTSYTDSQFWRPASVTDPANAAINFTYNSATSTEASLTFNSGSSTEDILQTVDSLGRTLLQQKRQAPGSPNFDSAQFYYDNLGRSRGSSLPYSGTPGQTTTTGPTTTATHDGLGRPLTLTDAAAGTISYTYSGNDVLVTVGPAPAGENAKQRQMEYDSLGRLTSVCEITGAAGSGACGQTFAKIGYWTKYTYNAVGNLLTVTQNAQAASTSQQSRAFAYDLTGRLISETNPENGITTYTFDTNASCGTSLGDLVKRLDAQGNTTCYAHDALHRVTSITYAGPYAVSTPNKYFAYDSATVNSVVMTNTKGRPVGHPLI